MKLSDESRENKLSMALCSSFFFNAARRLHNMTEDYILLSEGNIVNLDPLGAFTLKSHYPEYIVFTELAGHTAARGVMRTATAVKAEWIVPYVGQVKKIRADKLAQKKPKPYEVEMLAKREFIEIQEKERSDTRGSKVEEARARFLQRSQQRESNMVKKPSTPGQPIDDPTKKLKQ